MQEDHHPGLSPSPKTNNWYIPLCRAGFSRLVLFAVSADTFLRLLKETIMAFIFGAAGSLYMPILSVEQTSGIRERREQNMYVNYGDKDFFEYGRLVDAEHEENVYDILCCNPYPDEPGQFQFGHCRVDVTEPWIDQETVMGFIGMAREAYDPARFALGCVDYYSWDNFGAADYGCSYDWRNIDRDSICDILKGYLIACDNLEIRKDDAEIAVC